MVEHNIAQREEKKTEISLTYKINYFAALVIETKQFVKISVLFGYFLFEVFWPHIAQHENHHISHILFPIIT